MSEEEEEKERQKIFMDLHKDNQLFLSNAILTISSMAIPLLMVGISNEQTFPISNYFLTFSACLFLLIIIAQVKSSRYAIKLCNLPQQDREDEKNGGKIYHKAKCLNTFRDYGFMVALFCIIVALILNIFMKENIMTKKDSTTKTKTEQQASPKETNVDVGVGLSILPLENHLESSTSTETKQETEEGSSENK